MKHWCIRDTENRLVSEKKKWKIRSSNRNIILNNIKNVPAFYYKCGTFSNLNTFTFINPEGADPAGKPVLEPVGKPGKATPQTRPLEQVILGEKSTRYSNIDQILAKPAYQSRKAQFIVEMPAGRKEVLKEEKGAAERAEENRSESLFD